MLLPYMGSLHQTEKIVRQARNSEEQLPTDPADAAQNEAKKKCIRLTSCRQKSALMKFYDAALAQGVHDKVLTCDFFRFVTGAHTCWFSRSAHCCQCPDTHQVAESGGKIIIRILQHRCLVRGTERRMLSQRAQKRGVAGA